MCTFLFHISVYTARHFITRALLSASTFEQAQKILRDNGVGAGDGCSINMTFLKQDGERLFHNVEMGPCEPGQDQSQLNVLTASRGEHTIHANKYVFLECINILGSFEIILDTVLISIQIPSFAYCRSGRSNH